VRERGHSLCRGEKDIFTHFICYEAVEGTIFLVGKSSLLMMK
jgi:hypothetical protein